MGLQNYKINQISSGSKITADPLNTVLTGAVGITDDQHVFNGELVILGNSSGSTSESRIIFADDAADYGGAYIKHWAGSPIEDGGVFEFSQHIICGETIEGDSLTSNGNIYVDFDNAGNNGVLYFSSTDAKIEYDRGSAVMETDVDWEFANTIKTLSSGSYMNNLTIGGDLTAYEGNAYFGGNVTANDDLFVGDSCYIGGDRIVLDADNSGVNTYCIFDDANGRWIAWNSGDYRFELRGKVLGQQSINAAASGSTFNSLTVVDDLHVGNSLTVVDNVQTEQDFIAIKNWGDGLIVRDVMNGDFYKIQVSSGSVNAMRVL